MKNIEEREVEYWKDLEYREENCEKIGKVQKKSKLKCDMIWKIWKTIVKWYGKYRRKASWIVKRYENYGRKVNWIVKRFGKYRRK